jgi:hypothetical protein
MVCGPRRLLPLLKGRLPHQAGLAAVVALHRGPQHMQTSSGSRHKGADHSTQVVLQAGLVIQLQSSPGALEHRGPLSAWHRCGELPFWRSAAAWQSPCAEYVPC